MSAIVHTRSAQIEVAITGVDRDLGLAHGWKRNFRMGDRFGLPFAVYFRNDEPVKVDGIGRPHPKLVLAAASAAWRNGN